MNDHNYLRAKYDIYVAIHKNTTLTTHLIFSSFCSQ